MAQRIVFLDRDGVINERSPWIYVDPRRLAILEGVPEAIARLTEAGFLIVVVTNQPWVGYGLVSRERMGAFHDRIDERVRAAGGRIDAFHACTHRHTQTCACRKPGTGMLEEAARRASAQPTDCWMVGDKPSDVEAGQRFGARTVWVTGQRLFFERGAPEPPVDVVVEDLNHAVEAILDG